MAAPELSARAPDRSPRWPRPTALGTLALLLLFLVAVEALLFFGISRALHFPTLLACLVVPFVALVMISFAIGAARLAGRVLAGRYP